VDWIYLAQNRVQWRDIVNTVIKLGSLNGGEFLDQASNQQPPKKNSAKQDL
jgi:hypothetical protein